MRIHKHITREEAIAILDHYGWSALQLSEAAGRSDAWGRHTLYKCRYDCPMEWTDRRRHAVYLALLRMWDESWPQSPLPERRRTWALQRAEQALQCAEQALQFAEQERQRAERERQRAERERRECEERARRQREERARQREEWARQRAERAVSA